jgi:hypothetical protein
LSRPSSKAEPRIYLETTRRGRGINNSRRRGDRRPARHPRALGDSRCQERRAAAGGGEGERSGNTSRFLGNEVPRRRCRDCHCARARRFYKSRLWCFGCAFVALVRAGTSLRWPNGSFEGSFAWERLPCSAISVMLSSSSPWNATG